VPSAYVIFSKNKVRGELKERNLSFTEMARVIGENWRGLLPGEKELYQAHALYAKERYNAELSKYKKTSQYREYSQYLVEFKARQSTQQGTDRQLGKDTATQRKAVDFSPACTNQWPTDESRQSPASILQSFQLGLQCPRMASSGGTPLGYTGLNLIEALQQHSRRTDNTPLYLQHQHHHCLNTQAPRILNSKHTIETTESYDTRGR
jgi:hypothetical protein